MRPIRTVATGRTHRWRVPTIHRRLVSWVLVIFGSAAAAFGGLVAEDLFPGDGKGLQWNPDWWRIGALVLALFMAGWAARSLSTHRQQRGTLYYLRLQNETSPDYHRAAVSKAAKEYLAFRSIAAWCDPGPGTVDLRAAVAQMSTELERAINDDADDSGFDIAPNLVFPAALAIGYDWIPPGNVTLREFSSPRRDKKVDIQTFQWKLACATASGTGCDENGRLMHKRRHFDANASAEFRIRADDDPRSADTAARSVWLEFWLSDKDWSDPENAMTSPHKASADIIRTIRVEQLDSSPAGGNEAYRLLLYGSEARTSKGTGLTVLQIAEGASYWLRKTLEDFPSATVFVAGGMPKTVSFAMGYLMTRPSMQFTTAHPWRRIVPMGHFLKEPHPELRPTWVRADQKDPECLIRELAL